MLSNDQVLHIAKLARLHLKEGEAEKFAKQLSSILGYTELLNEVDTEGVEGTSQVTGLKNVSRKDEVQSFCTREELLSTTPLPVDGHQIQVKPVLGSE